MGTTQIDSIGVILLKEQGTRGTAETSLVNTDVAEVENPNIKIDYRKKEIDLVGSPQNQSIIGPHECTVSMAYPLRTGAAEGDQGQLKAPLVSSYLVSTDSDTDTDTTDDRFIYAPTRKDSEWVDSTLWVYSGSQDTSLCLLTKIQNLTFGIKFILDFDNAYASMQLEGKGVLVAEPALGTQPTITPSTVLTPALINTTFSFFSDSDYEPLSLEFDLGPDITTLLKQGVASGLGITAPGSKRKIKWSAKVYHDSGVNPHTTLLAGTLGTISCAWGTAPNKHTVSTTKAQITDITPSVQDNVQCFDVSGICVDNDFAYQVDTAAA